MDGWINYHYQLLDDVEAEELRKSKYVKMCMYVFTEEIQRRAQALEDMQRRLEEEHALQISLLLAEQEKEQQRLHMVSSWNHTIAVHSIVFLLNFFTA